MTPVYWSNSAWWLFDSRLLAVGHFDSEGRVLGSEIIEDPDAVAECVRLRDLLWAVAIPHADYKLSTTRP